MPMPAKGPHLALRKRKGRDPVWVIRDTGKVEVATGTGDRSEAEKQLAAYIGDKHAGPVAAGPLSPDAMTVAEVLDIYGTEHAPHVAAPYALRQKATPAQRNKPENGRRFRKAPFFQAGAVQAVERMGRRK